MTAMGSDDGPDAGSSVLVILPVRGLTKVYLPSPPWMRFFLRTQIREPVRAEDFAPTMAALLGVPLADVDGRVLDLRATR